MNTKIGFMQGRLSPIIDGKIQAFPALHWENEFVVADQISIRLMEWTLDQYELELNPLMTANGRETIFNLSKKYNLSIPSVTGDCFMQEPFWKESNKSGFLREQFKNICKASSKINANIVVVPLVDNGRIESEFEENILIEYMLGIQEFLADLGVKVAFETDFSPSEVKRMISRLPKSNFGINYDTGNSASLGFDPVDEFEQYGERIVNVHIKDRELGGSTVPLLKGNVNFELILNLLKDYNYQGNLIMQTARSANGDHAGVIQKYSHFIADLINHSHDVD